MNSSDHSCTKSSIYRCIVLLRAHLHRHRAERSFSHNNQLLDSRFIREKDYASIAVFVEDHRNVLQLVIIWQRDIYMLADSCACRADKHVCTQFLSAVYVKDDKFFCCRAILNSFHSAHSLWGNDYLVSANFFPIYSIYMHMNAACMYV